MQTQREIDFDTNYVVLTLTSAITFTCYFIVFTFLLNLTYIPMIVKNNGLIGIAILLSYFTLSIIALAPILILINCILGLIIIKIMRFSYIKTPLSGFLLYPAIMTFIPFLMNLIAKYYIGKINGFDYYYLYATTWIASMFQYAWMIKHMREIPEALTDKQSDFLKSADKVDYF